MGVKRDRALCVRHGEIPHHQRAAHLPRSATRVVRPRLPEHRPNHGRVTLNVRPLFARLGIAGDQKIPGEFRARVASASPALRDRAFGPRRSRKRRERRAGGPTASKSSRSGRISIANIDYSASFLGIILNATRPSRPRSSSMARPGRRDVWRGIPPPVRRNRDCFLGRAKPWPSSG